MCIIPVDICDGENIEFIITSYILSDSKIQTVIIVYTQSTNVIINCNELSIFNFTISSALFNYVHGNVFLTTHNVIRILEINVHNKFSIAIYDEFEKISTKLIAFLSYLHIALQKWFYQLSILSTINDLIY